MRSRLLTLLLAPLALAALSGCGGAARGSTGDRLVLTGSSTIAPLAAEIAKRFEERNPGVRVDVQTGGSSRGISDARQGLADIGMVSRALKPEERDLQAFPIARDGICLIVHRDNPVRSLTDEQVRALFTGKVDRWSAVGGAEAPVTVVHKAEGRSTLELFLAHYRLENREIDADVVIGDNEQGIKTVAGNPHAVGYVSIGAAEHHVRQGTPLKLLAVGGVEPSSENVRRGDYPLCRPLHLVTRSAPAGTAKAFLDFARSPEVRDLVEQQSFVPLPDGDAE
ncbi:MAG: phosphate ABC transporter substrate-binding protein [Armatimonadota bacterium]